jgi:hypothetical protein
MKFYLSFMEREDLILFEIFLQAINTIFHRQRSRISDVKHGVDGQAYRYALHIVRYLYALSATT